MVGAAGVVADFESLDGLKVSVYLQVTDDQGAADIVVDDILDTIRDGIADLDDFVIAQQNAVDDGDFGY